MAAAPDHTLEIAARVLALLDRGSFVATYKYAVLLGLLDLCFEQSLKDGEPPAVVTTRQLAAKVLELYWPQAREFPAKGAVLRQNNGDQAVILRHIVEFQAELKDAGISLWKAKHQAAVAFARLLDEIEWKLIEMPLPKLQRVGNQYAPFLYEIGWDDSVKPREVRRYQRGAGREFDNRIAFKVGVAATLVALNGLLRPFIHREWCSLVANLNSLPESELSDFLFGVERTGFPRALRNELLNLQDRTCFYCRDGIADSSHVDHFIPWMRFPTDAIENLVIAHASCNGEKRDHLAATDHLKRWWERCRPESQALQSLRDVAEANSWPSRPEETRSVCRVLYRGTPSETPLWIAKDRFLPARPAELVRALG